MRRTVFHYTDSDEFGGAEQVLLTLIAGVDAQTWRSVLVYHPSPGLAPLLEKANQLGVESIAVPRMPDGFKGARRVPHLVRLLWDYKPDVFHAHLVWPLACKFGLLSALVARVPAVVATVHLFLSCDLDPSIRLQHRIIAAKMGRYLAVSHAVARQLDETLPWLSGKVKVIHNGIHWLPFASPMDGQKLARSNALDQKPIVLTVARLDQQKGHHYLLEAAPQVPQARFIFAGDGPERSSLQAHARVLGLEDRVLFLGHRTDIPELLSQCDLFVLPSLYEGLPLAVLEAMAAGKPVVATSVGGTEEAVVPGETGLLVSPADPQSLAQAIQALLMDPVWGERMGQCGRARVRQAFSSERMVQEVTQVYAELLEPASNQTQVRGSR